MRRSWRRISGVAEIPCRTIDDATTVRTSGTIVSAIDDPRRADRAGALVAIVGSINVPIIYFSVKWWNTLHQGASVSIAAAPKMASMMLTGMLIMTLAFWAYGFAVVFTRVRAIVLEREQHTQWAGEVARTSPAGRTPGMQT